MIKQFLNSVIAKYHDLSVSKPKAEANNSFAQPRLIIVNKAKVSAKEVKQGFNYHKFLINNIK